MKAPAFREHLSVDRAGRLVDIELTPPAAHRHDPPESGRERGQIVLEVF